LPCGEFARETYPRQSGKWPVQVAKHPIFKRRIAMTADDLKKAELEALGKKWA
jgi:hypothetical protein